MAEEAILAIESNHFQVRLEVAGDKVDAQAAEVRAKLGLKTDLGSPYACYR